MISIAVYGKINKLIEKNIKEKLGIIHSFDYFDTLDELCINNEKYYDLAIIDIDAVNKENVYYKQFKFKNSIILTAAATIPVEFICLRPVGYISKPVVLSKICESINEFIHLLDTNNVLFGFYNNRRKIYIPKCKICFFESDKNKVVLHTSDEQFSFYGKIAEIADLNAFKDFLYVHKSFLVNPLFVECASSKSLKVKGTDIPISRQRYKAAEQWIKNNKVN